MLLHLTDGSGSFHLDYEPKHIAHVDYNASNRTVQVKRLSDYSTFNSITDLTYQISSLMNGELRITVTDQCLWTRQPASTAIQVIIFIFI